MIYVLNKIDLLDEDILKKGIKNQKSQFKNHSPVFVSALGKINLEELKLNISKNL